MNGDEWIKSKLNSIEDKVDKLDSRIDNIDVTLGVQSVVLQDHTRRSLANERAVDLLKEQIQSNRDEAKEDIKPLQAHIIQVHTVFKIIGVIASIAAIAKGLIEVLTWLKIS